MADEGPWSDYQAQESGPWSDYAPAAKAPAGPGPEPHPIAREIALIGRDIGEAGSGVIAFPHDLPIHITNALRAASNKAFGTQFQTKETFAGQLSKSLTELGAPTPTTPGEQMQSALVRGATGAATTGGVLGALSPALGSAGNLARTVASGITGAGAQEGARQGGYPGWVQTLAGIAGGMVPGAAESLVRGVGRTISPFTLEGRQQAAAKMLAKQATDPQNALSNLQTADQLVPGSEPTTGVKTQDPGLLSMEKTLRQKYPERFGQRLAEQNEARQAALTAMGGTPQDVVAAQAARDTETGAMREAAFAGSTAPAQVQKVQKAIDDVLASPAGSRESVSRTMNWAKDLIGDETDPARLYEIRKDLQLAQRGKLQPSSPNAPNASSLAQSRGQLGEVVKVLDDTIEDSAPGFKKYLQRYREMSIPIDQKRAIQEIQLRSTLTKTGEEEFLGNRAFQQQLSKAISKGTQFTPEQLRKMDAIRTDLAYGQAINSPLVRSVAGSDTFQNFSVAQAIGATIADAPVFSKITAPLRWLSTLLGKDKVTDLLADAMLDPKLATKLMQRVTPERIQEVSNALRSRVISYGAGAAAGIQSRPPTPQPRAGTPLPTLETAGTGMLQP